MVKGNAFVEKGSRKQGFKVQSFKVSRRKAADPGRNWAGATTPLKQKNAWMGRLRRMAWSRYSRLAGTR